MGQDFLRGVLVTYFAENRHPAAWALGFRKEVSAFPLNFAKTRVMPISAELPLSRRPGCRIFAGWFEKSSLVSSSRPSIDAAIQMMNGWAECLTVAGVGQTKSADERYWPGLPSIRLLANKAGA